MNLHSVDCGVSVTPLYSNLSLPTPSDLKKNLTFINFTDLSNGGLYPDQTIWNSATGQAALVQPLQSQPQATNLPKITPMRSSTLPRLNYSQGPPRKQWRTTSAPNSSLPSPMLTPPIISPQATPFSLIRSSTPSLCNSTSHADHARVNETPVSAIKLQPPTSVADPNLIPPPLPKKTVRFKNSSPPEQNSLPAVTGVNPSIKNDVGPKFSAFPLVFRQQSLLDEDMGEREDEKASLI